MFDRATLEARLRARPGRDPDVDPTTRRAAVAALLRWTDGEPEVLLMRRSEFEGDRWSGQVSMPGGRQDPGDADLRATATRETREELAVDLDGSAELLGRLDAIPAVARGGPIPMTITPFVFAAREAIAPRGNREVAAWFWLPLGRAARGELDQTFEYRDATRSASLPAWGWDGHVVWGLTFRMLRELLVVVG